MTNPPKDPSPVCFSHNHLNGNGHSLHTLLSMMASKHPRHEIEISAKQLSLKYSQSKPGTSERIIRLRVNDLVKDGWIEWVRPPERGPDGHWRVGRMRILSHWEWSKKHPGMCLTGVTGCHGTRGHRLPLEGSQVADYNLGKHRGTEEEKAAALKDSSNAKAAIAAQGSQVAAVQRKITLYQNEGKPMSQDREATPEGEAAMPIPFSDRSPAIRALALFLESRVGVKQKSLVLENVDKIDKLTPEEAEQICKWATADSYWGPSILGKTALATFCKNFPTIRYRREQELKAQQPKKNQKLAEWKAASVVADPDKPMAGEGREL